jgi:ferric-dicitrate binding protein FerR (iron transport regulator)
MNYFQYLLQRYIDNTATRKEREQLAEHWDELMDDLMWHEKDVDDNETPTEKNFKEEVFVKIVAEYPELAKGQQPEQQRQLMPAQRPVATLWLKLAAAVVIMAAGTALYYYGIRQQQPLPATSQIENADRLYTFSGTRYVKLPDGSKVLLNEGSVLGYHTSFGQHVREVTLTGEAYFDVQPDATKQFIVRSGKVTTSVLGTAFNVKAYPHDGNITVTVTRGKVHVGVDKKEFGTIGSNEQIAVNTHTDVHVKLAVNANDATAWEKDFLIFDNLSLSEAAGLIGRRYNVKVTLANDNLKRCRITATFLYNADLEKVLTAVSRVVGATYVLSEGSVRIEGKGCGVEK